MITVTLTTKELERRDACPPAMALFATLTESRGSITVEWTPLHALWLATAYPAYSGWLVHRGLVPAISLTRADLTGADLTRADLTGADLTGANLTGADLTGADLTRANLTGANLTGANLTRADLTGADLTRANLTGANLTGARVSSKAAIPGWTVTAMYCGCCATLAHEAAS